MALALEMLDCRNLPLANLPQDDGAMLAEAIVPAALARIDADAYASWGGGLSLDQYLRRERVLRTAEFSKSGLRSWLLRDGDAILASCESYAVPVRIKDQPALGFGIASVYVAPTRRGHGYASELLRRVHTALHQEGGQLCFLMSEIGPQLYARLGYVGRPLFVRTYAAEDSLAAAQSKPPTWIPLAEKQVAAALAECPSLALPLSVEVSAEQIMWHLLRSRYYAAVLHKKMPRHVGARSAAGDGLCLWAADYVKDRLRILTFVRGPRAADGVAEMLYAAGQTAVELGLSTIEIWENPHNQNDFQEHAGIRSTASDLPMLLGLSPEVHGEDWLNYERAHWL